MSTATVTTGLTRPAPAPRATVFRSTLEVAKRTVRKFVRTPQLVVVGTIQGALFLLIFRYVFGGAIHPAGGVSYVDFLVPGYVVTSILFSGMGGAAGMAEDLEQGFVDRLKSLPIRRAAVLAGRSLAETGLLTWSLLFTITLGFAVGFRVHADPLHVATAFGLCVVYGFAFTWLFLLIGLVSGTAQAAQGMSMLVFPLTFVSSAYVPVNTMPGWLQPIAQHQPITYMVNTVRALCLGAHGHALLPHATAHYLVPSLLWSTALVLVFAPLALWRFART